MTFLKNIYRRWQNIMTHAKKLSLIVENSTTLFDLKELTEEHILRYE